MSNGLTEIAYLCRELSIKHKGKYTACCDYYGTLDSIQVVVIHRDVAWPEVKQPVFNIDIRLDNQSDIDSSVNILKGML
jgi:hypothetical protein